MKYVKRFSEISLNDVPVVGGKNASLGEMFSKLSEKGIPVPDGFAVTAKGFQEFCEVNNISIPLQRLMQELDHKSYSNLREIGSKARKLISGGIIPDDLTTEIKQAYKELSCDTAMAVAVRSSATAEDLPEASFAGQHESYLNIKGEEALLKAIHKCYASLYTDRAIKYREDHGFEHEKVFLSAGVQKMVRADKACAGIGFTLEPESGFRDVIHLSGVWGLGENIVQGTVTPDEFYLFKPSMRSNKYPIIQKKAGEKNKMMVYAEASSDEPTDNIETPAQLIDQYVLSDEEIIMLGKWALIIEEHYKHPVDIEWAKDGETNQLYILQARPETVHASKERTNTRDYSLKEKGERICEGLAIGSKIVTGVARIINSPKDSDKLQEGDIIITDITSPDWDPLLRKARAIVTNKGGRTSHASIVARELDVPAIVGTGNATERIKEGEKITVSCGEGKAGYVYKGALKYEVNELNMEDVQLPQKPDIMMILGDPDKAFKLSFYPNKGIGLMRMEFIITNSIRVHPMALIQFDKIEDKNIKQEIEHLTKQYKKKRTYFTDKLTQGIATIAAAFYPKDVIVRMSDFKSNEYANLLGGKYFEPGEENPMIGFRGASRYYHPLYKEAFGMECEAVKNVRDKMGLTNVKVMIPFCRTVEEGEKVIDTMKEFGLQQHKNGLEVYVMVEIPSNVLLAKEFAEVFDGFSIGSNDLTQLTLGIDRDSNLISNLFDEENKAVKALITKAITEAKKAGIKVGLCGQAPSDIPGFAEFLMKEDIDSISFNYDALLKGIRNLNKIAVK